MANLSNLYPLVHIIVVIDWGFALHFGLKLNKHRIKKWLIALAGLIGMYSAIFGVCKFAAAMHDPLTPQEAKELEEADKTEKEC